MEKEVLFRLSANGDLLGYNDCDAKSITIPDGVRWICKGAFGGHPNLQIVYIPQSVVHIAGAAFLNCKKLQQVLFLDNDKRTTVLEIDDRVFEGCTSLRSINLPNQVSIGRDVFIGCCSLENAIIFGYEGKSIIHYSPNNKLPEYIIPEIVTIIEKNAFKDCTSLKSIIIPEGVTQIADFAFQGCTSLQKVYIPSSVTTIGRMAFDGCTNLMAIDVDKDNPRYLSYKGILFDYSDFSIIRFPPNNPTVTHINSIPDNVRYIGSGAFSQCVYIKSITIPISVVSIGDFAFQDCQSLEDVKILGSIDLISGLCFSGCKSLKSIHLPDDVTQIEDGAFWGCTSLQSIVLPRNLASIGFSAFCECNSLLSVYIPKNVTCIEGDDLGYGFQGAFTGCTSLNAIHCAILNPNDIEIGEDAFNEVDLDACTLFVPISILEEYRKHPIFGRFKRITEEKVES